jgi:hypothetical protein
MAKELSKVVKIENEEYNINAIYSDEAGKVSQPLTIKKSLSNRTIEESFDGSDGKTLEYVPSTGGKYKGPVIIDNSTSDYISAYNNLSDDDKNKTIVNSGQVNNRIVNLTGAPLCVWDASFNIADPTKNLYALKESSDKVHNFTVITGKEADLQLLQDVISGAFSEGSQELSYSLYSSLGGIAAGLKVDGVDNASGVVVVPAKHYGTYDGQTMDHNVSAVGDGVFSQKDAITGVVISQGVHVVGKNCFYGSKNLKYVVIPDSIQELGGSDPDNRETYNSYFNQCFYGCSGLKNVLLGTGIKSIGRGTFQNCTGLTSIVIPKNVTTIGREAFKGCTNLISIVLPAGLTSVADNAFADCSNLKTVYYTGQEANWAEIVISGTGNSQLTSAQKVYDYVVSAAQTAPSAPNAQVDVSAISNSPILYICEDDESITIPASNKIFLRLPGDSNFTEISKGAARLESPKGATNAGYYTYETLAAIIAGINSRLTALGSDALALPTTLSVLNTEHTLVPDLPNEIINNNENVVVEETVVPTVQELAEAIVKSYGNTTWDKNNTQSSLASALTHLKGENADNISALRDDLNALAEEVEFELSGENIATGINSRLDEQDETIGKIVNGDTLVGKAGKAKVLCDDNGNNITTANNVPVYFKDGKPVACGDGTGDAPADGSVPINISGNAATATQVNNSLVVKLNSGNAEDTNMFTFDGSAAKSINVTPDNIGAAPTSHASSNTTYGTSSASDYGHAKASSTSPLANGTAAVGNETSSFARGDHVHPLQTSVTGSSGSCTGNAATATTATNVSSITNNDTGNNANVSFTIGDKTFTKTVNYVDVADKSLFATFPNTEATANNSIYNLLKKCLMVKDFTDGVLNVETWDGVTS